MDKKLIFLLTLLFALQVSFAQNPIFKETKLFTLDNGETATDRYLYENGSWYLITEKGNEKSLIINGKREGWFEDVRLIFSEDGKRYAYVAQKELSKKETDHLNPEGKFYVVIDGVKGEEFDYIDKWYSLKFTPDDKVVYIASNGGEWNDYGYSGGKYFIIVDKQKSKPYDKVYDFEYLKAKDTFIAFVQDGNDILLVEYVNTK